MKIYIKFIECCNLCGKPGIGAPKAAEIYLFYPRLLQLPGKDLRYRIKIAAPGEGIKKCAEQGL